MSQVSGTSDGPFVCNRARRLPLAVAKEPWSAAAPKQASVADVALATPWRGALWLT